MNNFKEMHLSPVLEKALEQLGFATPTPIQAQTIPLALAGNDVMGMAQTGTGKTLAFAIPLIEHLLKNPHEAAIILAPTRELVQQVAAAIKQLIRDISSLKIAVLIGGEPIFKQFSQLKTNPNIIVGTPGRVIDHQKRGTLKTNNITICVLDETDRMFDMGFSIQIEQIVSKLSTERQNLMFSATFPPEIERLAAKYLKNPKRVSVSTGIAPVLKLVQEMVKIGESDKYSELLVQLDKREGSIIVFVKTKFNADRLAKNLCKERHVASAIHGDLRQSKRDNVMSAFRQGRCRIMVATDVASRGLDVPHVKHVINYDLPQAPEDYIHRVGRTARAGAEGNALSFVSPQEHQKWFAIQKFMDPTHKDEGRPHASNAPRRRGRNDSRKKPSGFAPRSNSSFAPRSDSKSYFGERKNTNTTEERGNAYSPRSANNNDERRSTNPYSPRAGNSDHKPAAKRGEKKDWWNSDTPGQTDGGRSSAARPARPGQRFPAKKGAGAFKSEGRWQKKPNTTRKASNA